MLQADPGHGGVDDAWWDALRRVMLRALDLMQSAARTNPDFGADLQTVLRGTVGARAAPSGAGMSGAGHAAEPAQTSPAAESPMQPAGAPAAGEPAEPVAPVASPSAPVLHAPAPATLLGPRVVQPPPTFAYQKWSRGEFDPQQVASNCRLKARAARWQTERRMRLDAGEDVADGDRALFDEARDAQVFLWMISPMKWRERSTSESVEIVAGCYDALADAAELMGLADRLGREQEAAMRLLAEAQSSVRAAVEDYASTRRDDDQEATFAWLRRETDVRSIYVEYMQLDHPAAPDNHADLRRRIAAVRQALDELRGRGQAVDRAIGKVKYHAGRIAQQPPGAAIELSDPDLRRIAETVQSLVDGGLPPSDVRLREALMPVVPRLGSVEDALDDSAPALARALEQIQDYLDQAAANEEARRAIAGETAADSADELVVSARQRVGGRDAVLIGGIPSELHRARLERGLALRSLNWVGVAHHESFAPAETAIRQDGIGLVMILTRWRSHAHGPAARELCRSLGIPLVELPAGYNLRQVAHRIVEQVAEQSVHG